MAITNAEIDRRIIKEIKQGNRDAFAELYDRHHTWLMAVAYRILQDRDDSEDLLHDVFLEIWKKAATYDLRRGTVQSWLAVKIRSRTQDRLRALNKIKRHITEQAEPEMQVEMITNEKSCVVDHLQARRMLELLTPVQRTFSN